MPSMIAWLDATLDEQKAARELIAMFSDKESRDELGIGPIRDAFSDLLFPGTSVLQTRARYYLFVPWCYSTRDTARLSGPAHRDRGRANERALIKTLRSSGATDRAGLIGARAGVNVRNLPSDIYWSGMLRYGIREHRGPIGSLSGVATDVDGATELTARGLSEWHPTIPPVPDGFPSQLDDAFTLTFDEATWLKERILSTTEGTLLAHLLAQGEQLSDTVSAPWLAAPETQFEELHHARLFSAVTHGAALLYNLLIAERHQAAGFSEDDQDLVADYRDRLGAWHEELLDTLGAELRVWDLAAMWRLVGRANPNVHPRTRDFVERWIDGLRATSDPETDRGLHSLVEERERRKGAQSRLKNEKMLASWSGASGTARLTYRWGTVKTIVNDVVGGLDGARS